MNRKSLCLTIALFIFSYFTMYGQTIIRNYSFEFFDATGRAVGWLPQNTRNRFNIMPDTVSHSGHLSILITPRDNGDETDRGAGLWNSFLNGKAITGKRSIVINAYVKIENLEKGVASIWMQLNGRESIIADKNSDDSSMKGNSIWTKYSIKLPLTDEVNSVSYGCKMTGKGKAWFDDFEVLVDDVSIEDIKN